MSVDFESTMEWRSLGELGDINVKKLFDMERVSKLLEAARSENSVSPQDADIATDSRIERETALLHRLLRGEAEQVDGNAYRWILLFIGGIFFAEAFREVAAIEMSSDPVSRTMHIAHERLNAEAGTLPTGVSESEAAARFVWEKMVRVPRFQEVPSLLEFRAERGPAILRDAFRSAHREIKTAPVGEFDAIGQKVKQRLNELQDEYRAEIDGLIEDYRKRRKSYSSDSALTVGMLALNLIAVKLPWLALVAVPASLLLSVSSLSELRNARALLREQERELLRVGCRPISHVVAATNWNQDEE